MTLAQRILRLFHSDDEDSRMELRRQIARAQAEAEDVNRSLGLDRERFEQWLRDNCKLRQQ